MPGWVQAVIAGAAVITALTVIWAKAIKPGAKIISQAEDTIPLLQKLTKEWADAPNLPQVLKEIHAQFKTNAGSSLRDAINRLEAAAAENKLAAEENKRAAVDLNMQMEVNRALADNDRRTMDRLLSTVSVLDARMRVGVQGVADIKEEQHGVAGDLAAAIERADLEDKTVYGSSADAALRSTPQEKQDTKDRHPE